MESKLVIAFVESVQDVFRTMLRAPVQVGKPRLERGTAQRADVSAIIGVTGMYSGAIGLSLSADVAIALVERFTGQRYELKHPDFGDAVGELTNMIAGGGKSRISTGQTMISCPSVIIGRDHSVSQPRNHPTVVIPFMTAYGDFQFEVVLRRAAESPVSHAASQADGVTMSAKA